MPIFYLDTSVIVKRYRLERGSDVAAGIFDSAPQDDIFCTSQLTMLEMTAACLRLAHAGLVDDTVAHDILAQFRDDLRNLIQPWPLSDDIVVAALPVIEQHRLRAGDAVHLATALAVASLEPNMSGVMVSSDRELLRAAAAAGLGNLDPTDDQAHLHLQELRGRRER